MPRPGYARITAARELAMPESAPNQKGEFAPSPWSSGSTLAQPVHRGHRRIGVGQSHMHVQRTLRRALDEPLHLPLHALVALRLDQLDVEQLRVGMKAGGHERGSGGRGRRPALGELGHRLAHRAHGAGAVLHLREERLVIEALARQRAALEDLIGGVRQLERLAVDDEELLLQADGEGLALTEAVGRGGLAHGASPSAARAAIRPNTSAAASPLA